MTFIIIVLYPGPLLEKGHLNSVSPNTLVHIVYDLDSYASTITTCWELVLFCCCWEYGCIDVRIFVESHHPSLRNGQTKVNNGRAPSTNQTDKTLCEHKNRHKSYILNPYVFNYSLLVLLFCSHIVFTHLSYVCLNWFMLWLWPAWVVIMKAVVLEMLCNF